MTYKEASLLLNAGWRVRLPSWPEFMFAGVNPWNTRALFRSFGKPVGLFTPSLEDQDQDSWIARKPGTPKWEGNYDRCKL